jgi:hypothetical protein
MVPDVEPALLPKRGQVIGHRIDRIELAQLRRSRHADHHEHRAAEPARLVNAIGEGVHRQPALPVDRDGPEGFLAEAEDVRRLEPGIVLVAWGEDDRPAIRPSAPSADALGRFERIAEDHAAGPQGGVVHAVFGDQILESSRAHMRGGEHVERPAVIFRERQGEGQPVIHPVSRPPHRLKIGHGAAGGEVSARRGGIEPHHPGQHRDRLGLDHRADLRGFLGGVVGIVNQGGEVAEQRRQRQLRHHVADIAGGVGGDFAPQLLYQLPEASADQRTLSQELRLGLVGRADRRRVVGEQALSPVEPIVEDRLQLGSHPGLVLGLGAEEVGLERGGLDHRHLTM